MVVGMHDSDGNDVGWLWITCTIVEEGWLESMVWVLSLPTVWI